MKKVLVAMACAWMLVSGITLAADEDISFDITTDFFSKYVWRGMVGTDDLVWQPGFSATSGGLTAGIWVNMNLEDSSSGDSGAFTEVDYYLDYSGSLTDTIGYSVGYIYYNFPEAANGGDTQEVYAGLSFDTFLSPSVTLYYDFDAAEGYYVAFGAGHSIEEFFTLGDIPVGLDIGANLGYGDSDYNSYYFGSSDSALNDLTISVGLPMEIGGWSVTPTVAYVTLIDEDIRAGGDANYGRSETCYTGISIGTSF